MERATAEGSTAASPRSDRKALQGNKLAFDPSADVNETAAIVLAAKRGAIHGKGDRGRKHGGKSAVRSEGPARQQARLRPFGRRERDRGDCARGEARRDSWKGRPRKEARRQVRGQIGRPCKATSSPSTLRPT